MEAATQNPEAAPLGRLLADERERQGLSRAEVAQRLHMSAYQVEALEAGDYSRLPKGTFLRGFVRNYAKVLGLDADALLSHLAQAAPRAPAPGIVVPSQNIRFDPLGERLASPYVKASVLALVFIALGFAAMYWWLFIRPTPPAAGAKKPVAEQGPPQQIAAPPQPAPEPVTPAPAPLVTEPSQPEAQKPAALSAAPVAEQAAAVEPARAVPVKSARDRTMRFRFRGESWVEVRNAQGDVLFSRLNAPGSEAEVSGRPPFTVVVGNAPEVEMTYNDRPFALEPHTRVAVARFTVE